MGGETQLNLSKYTFVGNEYRAVRLDAGRAQRVSEHCLTHTHTHTCTQTHAACAFLCAAHPVHRVCRGLPMRILATFLLTLRSWCALLCVRPASSRALLYVVSMPCRNHSGQAAALHVFNHRVVNRDVRMSPRTCVCVCMCVCVCVHIAGGCGGRRNHTTRTPPCTHCPTATQYHLHTQHDS